MQVLMLGNSFTYYEDMPQMLSARLGCPVVHHTRGGAWLLEHLDPNCALGARTQAALQEPVWSYVVLQAYSAGPIERPADFHSTVDRLCAQISAIHAVPVLYATWAYAQSGDKLLRSGYDYAAMYRQLHEAYSLAAERNHALLADVGTAFYERSAQGKQLYAEDGFHPNHAGALCAAQVLAKTIQAHASQSALI